MIKEDIKLTYHTTHHARRDTIREILDFDRPILDIGCGEGFYAIPFAQNLKEKEYIAIDPDDEMRELVKRKAESRNIENIKIYKTFQDFLREKDHLENLDIILTEVLEHLNAREAKRILQEIKNFKNFVNCIITTPNRDFNQFYLFSEKEMRHEGHIKEYSGEEFRELIESIC
ncbi:MAG: class I SAM-dependent methyltransferase [Candidatus Dojkabacteria bacterium]